MTYRLYRTPIPEESLTNSSQAVQSKLSSLGLLQGDSVVESISSDPSDVVLELQYRGKYAGRLALEATELLESSELQALPLSKTDTQTEYDGYYAVQSNKDQRLASQSDNIHKVNASLKKEGTRSSQRVAVRTRTTQPDPGNMFGNDTTALVAVPQTASRVRWQDRKLTTEEEATVVDTVYSRFGYLKLYDQRTVSLDDPILVYQPESYDAMGDLDVKVWDTYGSQEPKDSDGIVQWGRVFSASHEPREDQTLLLENGLIRIWIDETSSITAEQFDPKLSRENVSATYSTSDDGMIYSTDRTGGTIYPQQTGPWNTLLESSDVWSLADVDIITIGAVKVRVQLVFTDGQQEYALNIQLERGRKFPQFFIPETVSDPIPTELKNQLEPIAGESVFKTGATLGLVARRELRK